VVTLPKPKRLVVRKVTAAAVPMPRPGRRSLSVAQTMSRVKEQGKVRMQGTELVIKAICMRTQARILINYLF
jgi:hypothetical protein